VFSVGVHQEVAVLRGWLHGRIAKAPPRVRENIRATLGPGTGFDADAVVRRYVAFHRTSLLMYPMPRLRGFDDRRRWPIDGLEHLDDALASKRGVLLVTAHVGYGNLIGPILRVHGYDVVLIAARFLHAIERERAERWRTTGSRFRRPVYERTRVVAEILGPDDLEASLDVRPIVHALARNRVVLIAGDGQRSLRYETFPILGRSYRFSSGFMKIAMLSGCAVLPIFAVNGERGRRVLVELGPPLSVDPTATAAANLELFACVLDERLRDAPHLWAKWENEDLFAESDAPPDHHFDDPYLTRRL
jgi:lauroyl/myristoyl acyltransferase